MDRFKPRRGISSVVSEIILAATVLTIGGGIWYFSIGYCSVVSDTYIDETLELLNVATERFTVEQVYPSFDTSELEVWVNNYGDVDITVDVYLNSNNRTGSASDIPISSGSVKKIPIDFTEDPFEVFEVYQIQIYSRRQNVAYYSYTVG